MNILFVCKGNVVRSFAAEYFSRGYIEKNQIKNIEVSSAGTEAGNYDLSTQYKLYKKLDIDFSKHKQRKVNNEIIKNADVIIAMDKFIATYLQKHFGVKAVLFNEACHSEGKGVINYQSIQGQEKIVLHIRDSIPKLFEKIINASTRI